VTTVTAPQRSGTPLTFVGADETPIGSRVDQVPDAHTTQSPNGILMESNNPFGDVIHSYTRRQAVDDGVLVDLSQNEVTRQHWKYPVACTAAVWASIEAATGHDGNDVCGILHDVFTMAKLAARRAQEGERDVKFTVLIAGARCQLKLNIGPGDTLDPVLTLMMPNED